MIYHTSHSVITEVKPGLFGNAICFASKPYGLGMLTNEHFVYEIDNASFEFIEQHRFAFEDWDSVSPAVAELMDKYALDEETALDLLCGKVSEWDVVENCDADISLFLQKHAYDLAIALGYDGLETEDEQGTMWMLSAEHVTKLKPITFGEYQER